MASFGSFETEREVYSGATYTVYSAKKAGDPKTEYAIKLFHLLPAGLDAESAADITPLIRDIERSCADRIAVQQQAAASSKFVTPVIETGQDERGVWYATYFYPRSVNRIIVGRVALKRADLEHIIRSVAHGALDLKRTCGRSHGEILPSVIQISKSDELGEADVLVSDPLPGGAADAPHFEKSDLRAIGRVLLQLVLRREMTRDEDFLILPILPSPEWTKLFGKDSERWLALCNRLLDPNLSLDQFGLEQLVTELEAAKPRKGPPVKILVSAAAIIVLGGVVALIVLRPRQQTLEITSDPPGAMILLDSQPQPDKTPLKLQLKLGPHVIEARHPELHLLEQTTNWVTENGKAAKIHIEFPYGSVAIKSDPGAEIRRDGAVIGKIPADGSPFVISNLAAGIKVEYELVLEQHATKTVAAVIRKGERTNLSETLPLITEAGMVEFESTPSTAKIFINDKLLPNKETPTREPLAEGHYEVTAVYKDWPPKKMPVDVKKKATVRLNFDFDRGTVSLNSDPPGALVWIGTNWMGDTPTTIARPAGDTTFRFERPGFETTNLIVTVPNRGAVSVKPVLLTTNGVLEFTSDPPNAAVFDSAGKEVGRITPSRALQVTVAPDKPFTFSARAEGLGDTNTTLSVHKRETKPYKFVFAYGSAQFEGLPPGAGISTSGKSVETAASLVQRPGIPITYHITAPGYIATNVEVTVRNHELNRSIGPKLLPEPVKITLSSDPTNAQFFAVGQDLRGTNGEYLVGWGPVTLVAQYPRLGFITNQSTLYFDKPNNIPPFRFKYGTLLLSNLPSDLELYEGAQKIAAANQPQPVYERLGTHTYRYAPADRFKPEEVTTNIVEGLNFLLRPEIKGFLSGVGNIQFAWVPLPGGGTWEGKTEPGIWAGVYEVTQAQYQEIMGANPSAYKASPNCPVESLTWDDAVKFCQALTGKDPKKPRNWHYGLPSKAQFDIFALVASGDWNKAGMIISSPTKREHPEPVGSTGKPNTYGLYDVIGNVSEWLDSKGVTGGSYVNSQPYTLLRTESNKDSSPSYGFRVVLLPGE